jgi:uncharacterized damage-inducible protein DinB
MAIKDGLLGGFDNEMDNTRHVLERIPEDKFGWKPHPKSGTMIWLAGHVANLAGWGTHTLQSDEMDIAPGGKQMEPPPTPKNRQELLAIFDKGRNETRKAIEAASDADLMKPWSLKNNGQNILTMPKVAVLRGVVINHLIHHRGQLTVYLRLNDVPVPALYGPSADEGRF